MGDENPATPLLQRIARWSGDEPLYDSARLRPICHQPQNGDLAYLHRLYPGLRDVEVAEVEASIGQSMPPRLRTFYGLTNGARFFEGQVSVSGLVRDISRDPLSAVAVPISIEQDNRAFAGLRSKWHRLGYFRIGAVAFLRQDELVCGPNDRVVVVHAESGEALREYADVFACLESFVLEMGQFWTDDGVFAGDWGAIDRLLLGSSGMA